ncbi:eukaryotic phosphomannomutase, partial [Kipferlia bialata]
VSGSDMAKIEEQLGKDVTERFDFVFSENGLVAFKGQHLIGKESIVSFLGEDSLQEFTNDALLLVARTKLPFKRGTFIEMRTGMVNVCPCGRQVSQAERDSFAEYDKKHRVRQHMVKELDRKWGPKGLGFGIGGQISFDVMPQGWDKTFVLRFLHDYRTIHFFGDKTRPGGNDAEICDHARTEGHSVVSPQDTLAQVKKLFPGV